MLFEKTNGRTHFIEQEMEIKRERRQFSTVTRCYVKGHNKGSLYAQHILVDEDPGLRETVE